VPKSLPQRLKPPSPSSTTAPRFPAYAAEGLSCPHYAPLPDSRRCRHYWDGSSADFPSDEHYPDLEGACDRDDEFMCIFWLAKYPSAYEDPRGKVHRVDTDGVVHLTPAPKR